MKLGRIFLWKQIHASLTANLTESIYLLNDLQVGVKPYKFELAAGPVID